MTFEAFKVAYQKAPVVEYPNQVPKDTAQLMIKVLTYNHVNYIEQCLDSILMQQTTFDFYILLGEDESNDGTREICIEYAKKYPTKIRLLLHDRKNNIAVNGKPTGLFNSIYSKYVVDTKYEAFCEGDDYWTDSQALQQQYDYLENHPETVLAYYYADRFFETEQRFEKYSSKIADRYKVHAKELRELFIIPHFTSMYRSGLIEIFTPDLLNIIAWDKIVLAKLLKHGNFKYLSSIQPAIYRIHNASTFSSLSSTTQLGYALQIREYILNFLQKEHKKLMHQNMAYMYFKYFCFQLFFERHFSLATIQKSLRSCQKGDTNFLAIIGTTMTITYNNVSQLIRQ